MGRIRIRLLGNPKTGKKDILIEYESDADRTQLEHERRHREIVELLVGRGVLKEDELGEVRVERVAPQEQVARRLEELQEEAESESLAEGG